MYKLSFYVDHIFLFRNKATTVKRRNRSNVTQIAIPGRTRFTVVIVYLARMHAPMPNLSESCDCART